MELNYTAFLLISTLPLIIAAFYYNSKSPLVKALQVEGLAKPLKISILKLLGVLLLSMILTFGFVNLVIHQMGFYELFFTDIIRGDLQVKQFTDDFLAQYGQKHRYFSHGFFHGIINAFTFALPFISFQAILHNKGYKYVALHFGFWLICCSLLGGLIAQFV